MKHSDQTGHAIDLPGRPARIVSVVPSQSEYLWDIGLGPALVGITRFCVHPAEMFRSVPRVGGTKRLDLAAIRRLRPDLVVGNKEENDREQIEALRAEFNVWTSDIYDLGDAFEMMRKLGEVTGRSREAEAVVGELRGALAGVEGLFAGERVAYLIWNDPLMLAAGRTFIDAVLRHAGFRNALEGRERYPALGPEELRSLQPDLCLLPSEPFPFGPAHQERLQALLPRSRVVRVDGEVFSWYGTRLRHLPARLRELRDRR